MHAPCRLGLAGLAVSLSALPAMAVREVLAAPKQTTSVAAFPDAPTAAPARPEPPKHLDSSEELLQKSPYPTMTPVRGARDVPMANPYVEELRIIHSETVSPDSPYAEAMHPDHHHHEATDGAPARASMALKDPYGAPGAAASAGTPEASDAKQGIPADLKNPYGASDTKDAPRTPPRPSSELVLELPPAFQGVILVDGLAAPRGATFPVPPGHHTVSVFPKEGHPYQLPVFVRPDRTERLAIP